MRRQRRRELMPFGAAAVLALATCAAPQQAHQPLPADTAPLAAEPAAHPPGRVPPPGPYLPGFRALHYHIALDVPATGARIRGTATMDIAVEAPRADTLRLDLNGMLATSVTLAPRRGVAGNSDPVTFRQRDGRIFIALPQTVHAGDTIRVAVAYAGTPDDGLIIRTNVHGERGAFGDNWPDRARFWFPSVDHPSHKATVAFEVRAPTGWQVVANGVRADALWRPLGGSDIPADAAPPPDGVWRWRMDQPIPTYLMVVGATRFAVGSIDECALGGRTVARPTGCVPTGYWVFPQDSANAGRIFRRGADMLTYYSALIAPYPYERLAHVQSATRFGGMENAGAIFYSDQAITRGTLSEGTVAHEVAHQWFGNAVTPARWADLWLSEGFATYFGALYFEHADGVQRFREMLDNSRAGYFRSQVQHLPVVDTLSVPGNDLLELLNANSYAKGAAVLHMLRGLLGDSAFFGGVRRYYHAHVHGNATTADLRRALEAQSGRELGWFFDQWLYRPGHPVFRVSHRWDAAAGESVVHVEQVQPQQWPTFRVQMQVEIPTANAAVRREIEVAQRSQEFRFRLNTRSTGVRLDPDGWLLKVVETYGAGP